MKYLKDSCGSVLIDSSPTNISPNIFLKYFPQIVRLLAAVGINGLRSKRIRDDSNLMPQFP